MRNLVVIVILGLVTVSYANPPKYARKVDLKLDVKPSPRVKPIQVAPATQKPVTPDDVLAREELVDPLRQEQEAMLIQLIGDTPDSDPDKPEYMFRLAEGYARQLRLWRLKSVELTIGPRTHDGR
jgi:hypothetical protein